MGEHTLVHVEPVAFVVAVNVGLDANELPKSIKEANVKVGYAVLFLFKPDDAALDECKDLGAALA